MKKVLVIKTKASDDKCKLKILLCIRDFNILSANEIANYLNGHDVVICSFEHEFEQYILDDFDLIIFDARSDFSFYEKFVPMCDFSKVIVLSDNNVFRFSDRIRATWSMASLLNGEFYSLNEKERSPIHYIQDGDIPEMEMPNT